MIRHMMYHSIDIYAARERGREGDSERHTEQQKEQEREKERDNKSERKLWATPYTLGTQTQTQTHTHAFICHETQNISHYAHHTWIAEEVYYVCSMLVFLLIFRAHARNGVWAVVYSKEGSLPSGDSGASRASRLSPRLTHLQSDCFRRAPSPTCLLVRAVSRALLNL